MTVKLWTDDTAACLTCVCVVRAPDPDLPVIRPRGMIRSLVPSPSSENDLRRAEAAETAEPTGTVHAPGSPSGAGANICSPPGNESACRRGPTVRLLAVRVPPLPLARPTFAAWLQLLPLVRSRRVGCHPPDADRLALIERDLVCVPSDPVDSV